MKFWVDLQKCTGCLRCELACSFHHSGHTCFEPERSSIRIYRSNIDRSMRMVFDDSCDYCPDERPMALCVGACVFGALGIIRKEAA